MFLVTICCLFVEDFRVIHECPSKTLFSIQGRFHKYFIAMDSNKKQKTYMGINIKLETYKFCTLTLAPHPLSKLFSIIQPTY